MWIERSACKILDINTHYTHGNGNSFRLRFFCQCIIIVDFGASSYTFQVFLEEM